MHLLGLLRPSDSQTRNYFLFLGIFAILSRLVDIDKKDMIFSCKNISKDLLEFN